MFNEQLCNKKVTKEIILQNFNTNYWAHNNTIQIDYCFTIFRFV